MTHEEFAKKYLWKCYKGKSDKTLCRCINVFGKSENYGDGDTEVTYFIFETLYIESGDEKVNYGRDRMLKDYFLDKLKPIKESEFEALRDRAIAIIRGGVIGDMPILKEHTEELFA